MPVYQPTYKDQKTGEIKFVKVWWYSFTFAGKRIRESTKTTSKILARLAEQKRRRELEEGFNGVGDRRNQRIRTIEEIAVEYLEDTERYCSQSIHCLTLGGTWGARWR